LFSISRVSLRAYLFNPFLDFSNPSVLALAKISETTEMDEHPNPNRFRIKTLINRNLKPCHHHCASLRAPILKLRFYFPSRSIGFLVLNSHGLDLEPHNNTISQCILHDLFISYVILYY